MTWDSKTPTGVTIARLMNSPPSDVYCELKESVPDRDSHWYRDKKIEEALLGRNDPLITLGLAQYCTSGDIGKELYKRGGSTDGEPSYNKALRLAVLSNSLIQRNVFLSGTFGVIPDEEVLRLINLDDKDATDELQAMLGNPGAKRLLDKLYNAEKPFDAIPEDKYLRAVFWSHDNPVINEDDGDVHGPDTYAIGIHRGIKRLMQTLPVTGLGLQTAYWLLYCTAPHNVGSFNEDPTPMFNRWQALEVSEEFNEYHSGDTSLRIQQEFLCMLAAVYGRYMSKTPDGKTEFVYLGAADSPDLLLRCAYYGHASKLTDDQMRKAHDRDGDAFLIAALNNDSLFWNRTTRAVFEDLMYGQLIHRYRRRCEQIKKRRPQFDTRPVSEQGLTLLEDEEQPTDEQKRLDRMEAMLIANAKQVQRTYTLLSWVLVLVIVAVLLLWQRHLL